MATNGAMVEELARVTHQRAAIDQKVAEAESELKKRAATVDGLVTLVANQTETIAKLKEGAEVNLDQWRRLKVAKFQNEKALEKAREDVKRLEAGVKRAADAAELLAEAQANLKKAVGSTGKVLKFRRPKGAK